MIIEMSGHSYDSGYVCNTVVELYTFYCDKNGIYIVQQSKEKPFDTKMYIMNSAT